MLDLAIRDLTEHKVRTFLTGLGIFIAITAIVSLGSISAGINELISGSGSLLGSDTIFVMKRIDLGSAMSGPPGSFSIPDISVEEIDAIYDVPGIERAVPLITRSFGSAGFMEIDGINMDDKDIFGANDITFKEGGWPENDDTGIAIGYLIAESAGVGIGDYLTLNGKDVEVTGIFEEGSSSYDYAGIMPFAAAEEVYETNGKATEILIEPEDLSLVEDIKATIEEENDDLMAMTFTDALETARESTSTITIMTLGIGLVASLVAAIGIVITMYTSVMERRRDIGIMKAVGAKKSFIIINMLQESVMLSLASGILGVFVSLFMVDILNEVLIGTRLAIVTPTLAVGAVAYGVILTFLFSLYPAWIAAKTDPIIAIREG